MRQDQHIVPQVYLKQFGYLRDKQWKISSLEREKVHIMDKINKLFFSQKSIVSVTAHENIFDLNYELPENVKLLEKLHGRIEDLYLELIEDINTERQLSGRSKAILVQLIPNLISRSYDYREFLNKCLNSKTRDRFLASLTTFHEDKGDSFIDKLNLLPIEEHLNPVSLIAMEHIMNKLAYFNYAFIKQYNDRYWITSDQPVVLTNCVNPNSIFSIDTELYFPVSRDYLIFMYHPNSISDNPLRRLKNESFNNCSEEIQEMIYKEIWRNAHELVFFPYEINEKTTLK